MNIISESPIVFGSGHQPATVRTKSNCPRVFVEGSGLHTNSPGLLVFTLMLITATLLAHSIITRVFGIYRNDGQNSPAAILMVLTVIQVAAFAFFVSQTHLCRTMFGFFVYICIAIIVNVSVDYIMMDYYRRRHHHFLQ